MKSDVRPPGRVFAVIPAAGLSRRMGRPKLLLSIAGRPVIHHVIDAFRAAGVADVWVHVREDDAALQEALEGAPVTVTRSPETAGMRESVQVLLEELRACRQPTPDDAWLLSPADHPTLRPEVIRLLVAQRSPRTDGIWAPTWQGRRGHPVLFSWRYADLVPTIPEGCGLNHLLRQFAANVVEIPVETAEILTDLDTPDDYERALAQQPPPTDHAAD